MNIVDEHNIVNNLLNKEFKYRDILNVDNDIPFGMELEFVSYNKKDVDKIVKDLKAQKKNYKVDDANKSYNLLNENKIYELKTPSLYNNTSTFKDIKDTCDILERNKVQTSNNKGMHVHVDLSSLDEYSEYLFTFLKIFSIYEHIIFRFSYGEDETSNINISSYSREISNLLYNYLSREDLSDDFNHNIDELQKLLTCKSYALNFHKKDNNVKNDTIEMRTFNSTLNPIIIQNNINLFLSIISSIRNNEIDKDLINYRFEEYDKGFYVRENYSKINESDALEFSDLIFSHEIDKEYFLRQYEIKKQKIKKLVI